jgi:ArsR family transcriptional regulator
MRELIQVLKAVADKNRIRIIKMLEKKKMCVCELSAVLEITQPSVSKHLSILNHAGIIKGERNSQWIDYSLCTEKINQYTSVIQDMIKNWLNNDLVIENDLRETKKLCREYLCKKK